MISGLVSEKKQKKKNLLLAAALELFLSKGSDSTSIDDIVRKAGVAKGTFYLYFHDRGEILKAIMAERSDYLLRMASEKAELQNPSSATERLLFIVEALVDEFARHPVLLGLMYRNLTWGILLSSETVKDVGILGERGQDALCPSADFDKMAFVIMELVTSVCYSSIILGEPAGIEVMKPFLLSSIRRLLVDEDKIRSMGQNR